MDSVGGKKPLLKKTKEDKITQLQKLIAYHFKNPQLLTEALTHSSYANEIKHKKVAHNERLEFLGDSVLSIVISDYIFHKYKQLPEGELTKVRANVVCESSLAIRGKEMNLGDFLTLGRGEELSGGRQRVSILADAFEALIGALYLDGGLEVAKSFILTNLEGMVESASQGNLFNDFKTHLQELIQSRSAERITYRVVTEKGPDHDKLFEIEVALGGQVLGAGTGKSKKEAEQRAAQEAVEKIRRLHG